MIWRWHWLEYVADVTPHDYRVDYKIYRISEYRDGDRSKPCFHRKDAQSSPDNVENIEDAECFMTGHVKWDGCSNWTMTDPYFHACSRQELEQIGQVLTLCWDLTKTLCPHWDKTITEVAR